MKVLAGLYSTYSEANSVVRDLVDAGFSREMISIVASNAKGDIVPHTPTADDAAGGFSEHRPENYAEGDAVTSGQGAGFGAVVGTLVALGALLIPGIGPIVAAGPLAVALGAGVGAAAGALTGGITAGLVKTGISEEDAEYYAEGIRSGGTLVSIEVADDDADDARRVMEAHTPSTTIKETSDTQVASAAHDTADYKADTQRSTATVAGAVAGAVAGEEGRFQVMEEDLNVGKRQVQGGGVRVYSTISERPVEEQVRLRSERVTVDRQPVDKVIDPSALNNFQQDTVEVTEFSEVPVVQKTARVVEEVTVGKAVDERVETVHDTVRRTDVNVEHLGADSDYNTYATHFRNDFDTNYASGGYSYDEYEPAYRYGWELSRDSRYTNRDWSSVEGQLRSDWEQRYPNNAWDRFSAAVKNAWNQARG